MLIVSLEIFYEDFQIHLGGTRKGDVRKEFFFPPSKKKSFYKIFHRQYPSDLQLHSAKHSLLVGLGRRAPVWGKCLDSHFSWMLVAGIGAMMVLVTIISTYI